jgi:hypothetical protein
MSAFADSKRLIVYKPQGKHLSPDIVKKIKTECNSEYIFYIQRDLVKNMWYCSTQLAVLLSANQYLLSADTESILVFGEHYYPQSSAPISFRNETEEDDWVMTAGIGKLTFMTAVESAKIFFDNFLSFLDCKGINKILKKVCEACPGVSYVVVNKNGPKMIGDNWEEKDGISYTSTAFFNKLNYAQKSFGKNVLAFLSKKDIVEELKRLDNLSEPALIQEIQANQELWEKVSKL